MFAATTPDNSFLGFIVSSSKLGATEKKPTAVVYGKETKYLLVMFQNILTIKT